MPSSPLLLNADELLELTGYHQPARQARWLAKHLGMRVVRRADGRPVVPRSALDALTPDRAPLQCNGPNWSTP